MIRKNQLSARRGSLLLEVVTSIAVLGTVLVFIARMVVAINTQSHLVEQRELASQTLQNTIEELSVLSIAERASLGDAPLPLGEEIVRRLPSAELTAQVEMDDTAGVPAAQRVTLRLAWEPSPDAGVTALALTTFFYRSQDSPQ